MASDILKESSALCIGIAACTLGVAGAGLTASLGAAALAVVAFGKARELSADRRRVEQELKAYRDEHRRGHAREPDIARMDSFLSMAMSGVRIERSELQSLLKGGRFVEAASDDLMLRMGVVDTGLSTEACDYARGLIETGLRAAMDSEKNFRTLQLEGLFAGLREHATTHEKLDGISEQIRNEVPRSLLENLALRFEHDNPDAPVAELMAFLKSQAIEFKNLKARVIQLEQQLRAIGAPESQVAALLFATRVALDAGLFEEARARIKDARKIVRLNRTMPALRQEAKLFEIEADSLLLEGDIDAAAEALEAAAALSRESIDRWKPRSGTRQADV